MLDKISWKDLLAKARKGDANAQVEVAEHFIFGLKTNANKIIVRQNAISAFSWYKKAAKNGVVEALTNVADFLSEGKGCKKDKIKSKEYYSLAINNGSSRAAFNLGTIYRDDANFKKAFEYYSLPIRMENADHSFTIGLCYYYGVGVSVDKVTACKHFFKSFC